MRYVLLWIPVLALVVAAILVSDAARFRTPGRVCGYWPASLVFALLVTVHIVLSVELLAFESVWHALIVGVAWSLATVVVDLAVAAVILRGNWAAALLPYDLRAGQFWSAVLLWIALAPALVEWLLG